MAERFLAARDTGAFFPVTVRMDAKVRAAIAAIGEEARTPVRYPRAIFDDQPGCWVSGAQVAQAEYTAFTSRKCKGNHRPAHRPPRPRPQRQGASRPA